MRQKLLITIFTQCSDQFLSQICQIIAEHKGNLIESRLNDITGESVYTLAIDGSWDVIAKCENALLQYCRDHSLQMIHKRIEHTTYEGHYLNYQVQATGINDVGILSKLVDFFVNRKIRIQEIASNDYAAAPSDTPCFIITMLIMIPADTIISQLREHFFEYSEQYNLDVAIEPEKL